MTVSSSSSAQVLRQFFTAFGQGDGAAVVRLFADDATITAVRPGERQGKGLYGTYRGKEGAQQFLTNLGLAFETQAFSVDHVVGEGETAFAQGSFTHRVKATGKLFASSWALRCLVRQGHIVEYQFFEDSAAFAEAAR